MPKFKCKNEVCSLYDQEVFFTKISSSYSKKLEKMVVKESVCKNCGQVMEFVEEDRDFNSIQLLKVGMMSHSEKMNVLKKRSRDQSIPENRRLSDYKKFMDTH